MLGENNYLSLTWTAKNHCSHSALRGMNSLALAKCSLWSLVVEPRIKKCGQGFLVLPSLLRCHDFLKQQLPVAYMVFLTEMCIEIPMILDIIWYLRLSYFVSRAFLIQGVSDDRVCSITLCLHHVCLPLCAQTPTQGHYAQERQSKGVFEHHMALNHHRESLTVCQELHMCYCSFQICGQSP